MHSSHSKRSDGERQVLTLKRLEDYTKSPFKAGSIHDISSQVENFLQNLGSSSSAWALEYILIDSKIYGPATSII